MFFRANVQPRPMAGHQWLQRFQQPWSCEPQQLLVRVISSLWLHWPLFYMYSEEITTPPSLENPPCQKRCLINGCQRGEENPLNPWNAPGSATVFGNGCGVNGGNPDGCKNGSKKNHFWTFQVISKLTIRWQVWNMLCQPSPTLGLWRICWW